METALQREARQLIQQATDDGTEYGVQAAVYHRGQCILDISAGTANVDAKTPVIASTLFPVFSATKGVAAAAVHMLAQRGRLRYDDRIAELWPEFAGNGKQGITIAHALCHTAGLARLSPRLTPEQIADWQAMCRVLCDMTPQTEPGSRMEYHAMTFGWLLGEIVRRVDGRSVERFIQQEICQPLGIHDLYLGIECSDDGLHARVATLYEPGAATLTGDEPASVPPAVQPLPAWMNTRQARAIPQPATCGVMSARALARFYAALLPGGVDGVELLPPERVRRATCPPAGVQPDGPRPMAMGFRTFPDLAGPASFGHAGYGGSLGLADPERGIAFGYAHNLFTPQGEALRDALLRRVIEHTGNRRS
jgi:CubicO group peptidase (beta-lactamase class C family)